MGRWEPDARGRLMAAAIELSLEHGFEQTTVADIAARAGLTERTFYRHYADKREVLFAGPIDLHALLAETIAAQSDSAAPIDAVAAALDTVSGLLQQNREGSRLRQRVIDANPMLRERELIKLASLGAAMADALRTRGVTDPTASLTAEAGIAAFKVGFETWINDATDAHDLQHHVRECFDQLKAVTAGR